jgi:hypothetical protein
MLTLDNFSDAAPTPVMRPERDFEEKSDNSYELEIHNVQILCRSRSAQSLYRLNTSFKFTKIPIT